MYYRILKPVAYLPLELFWYIYTLLLPMPLQIFWFCVVMQCNLITTSSISDYDLGAEGDLFKAPEPIIEEPLMGIDPMTAAISMISCGGDVIASQDLKVSDIESSIDNCQLFSEVFYECKKDILAKEATDTPLSEVLDIKIPLAKTNDDNLITGDMLSQGQFQKSVSSGCLNSMEWIPGTSMKPNFLDFSTMDLGSVYGMRRAYSDGDIKVKFSYFLMLSLHRLIMLILY